MSVHANSLLAYSKIALTNNQKVTKVCTICKQEKALEDFNTRPDRPGGYRSECRKCQYKRQEQRTRDPKKVNANHALHYAMRVGKIVRPLCCSDCGTASLVDGHHPDYSLPLNVIWLCRKCHTELHCSLKIA